MQRLIVAHAHEVTRIGLRYVTKGEFEVAASVDTVKEAMEAVRTYPEAILLTDVFLLDDEVFGLIVAAADVPMKVALLTGRENDTYVARALVAGASDCIDLRTSTEEIMNHLRSMVRGEEILHNRIAEMRNYLSLREEVKCGGVTLTKREGQTLRHLALGLSNAEIGKLMGISIETVKEHVQHLLRKMKVNDRTQAAVWYVRKQMEQEAA